MKLGTLLAGLVEDAYLQPHGQTEISGVYDDSRAVTPGGAFFALRGSESDGRRFIADAVQRGAAFIIGDELPEIHGAVALPTHAARTALAHAAARWYGLPAAQERGFKLLSVTGTNGKSTTVFMACAVLRAAGLRCAMLGTVQYDLCGRTVRANMTTPGPAELCSHLRECVDAGAAVAVMEVSSHALDQRRTDGLRFAAAAFTNLTGDHLDYHGTLENYRDAKARLFANLDAGGVAVLNRDDPAHAHMAAGCRGRVVTYALDSPADITARITRDTVAGTLYRMRIGGRDLVLENALVGRHNVYNALAAAGLAWAAGVPSEAIEAGLNSVRNVPGRLQRVPAAPGVEVFVDYAHTDDALRNVLSVLRPLTPRRLMVVFGCGGDRDRTKRPRMARVAAELADALFVTSDNPRTERPEAIIEEILAGLDDAARRRAAVEPDRRCAIHAALAAAQEGDVVLIAGKGHEDYQVIGKQRIHFDDVEVAIQAAAELRAGGGAAAQAAGNSNQPASGGFVRAAGGGV